MNRLRAIVTWSLCWTLAVYLGGIVFDANLLMACGANVPVALWVLGMSDLGLMVAGVWLAGTTLIALLGLCRILPGARVVSATGCPACGYDCEAVPANADLSKTCPECGGTVAP